MIQIAIILFIYIIILIAFRIIYVKYNSKDILEIISDDSFKQINTKLKDNVSICKEILEDMNNKDVKVILNENKDSKDSFYNVFNNTIVLCNNEQSNGSFSRLLFISHECQHSRQDKKFLWTNFIFANINIIYFFVTSILIFANVINKEMYMMCLGIMLVINIFSYLSRYIIEADATYMSLNISRKYASKYLYGDELEKVMSKFEEIISKGFSTFVFGILLNNIPMIIIYMMLMIVKYLQI